MKRRRKGRRMEGNQVGGRGGKVGGEVEGYW